jgi:hypothetical protein
MIPSEEYATRLSDAPPATHIFPEISLVPVFEAVVSTAALRVYETLSIPAPVTDALYVVGPKVNAVDAYDRVSSAFPEVATVHVSPSAEYARTFVP